MNTTVMWESQLERDYIYFLEIDPEVVAYYGQPFTIAYDSLDKRKKYTPDFLVERNNFRQIVEVKPESKINDFQNSHRFRQAASFCLAHDLEFGIFTEKTIRVQPRLNNIKLLYKYARVAVPWHIYNDCLNYFNLVKSSTILEAETALRVKEITYSYLLKLLWSGFLFTDMMRSITSQSLVQLSPSAIAYQTGVRT